MNILVFSSIHKDIWGGGEKWMTTTAAGLRDKGHQVTVAGRPDSIFLQKSSDMNLPTIPVTIGGDLLPSPIFKLAAIYRRLKIDVVLLAFNKDAKIAGMAAWFSRKPIRIPMHGLPILTDKAIDRFIVNHWVDGIIVNATAFKRQYLAYGWVKPEMVHVINNGLETDVALIDNRPEVRHKYNLPENRPVVGIFGRLHKQKQHHYFLEAAEKILKQIPGALFLIIGEGEERVKIENLIKELKIEDSVYLLGMQKEVFELYSYCDLVLLTSSSEGIPNVVIESMLMATPVVAFDVGGVAEAIKDRSVGIVVPANDVTRLANEALALLADDKRRLEMGKAARKLVQEKFPMQKMIDATETYIASLLNRAK